MFSEGSPVYFWRETEKPYGFLSQWYGSRFTAPATASAGKNAPALVFLTTEQYMMYHKAMLFQDRKTADKIMLESNPRKQQALGRQVQGFDGKIWNQNKEKIVEEGNWWKFRQPMEEDLQNLLLETGDRKLVEASPYDRTWGIGFSAANAEARTEDWGENLLGKALMRVRDRLRKEQARNKELMKEVA